MAASVMRRLRLLRGAALFARAYDAEAMVYYYNPLKGGIGNRQTILLARRTRTMKLCSFDARSKGQFWRLPTDEKRASMEGECETAGMVSVVAEPRKWLNVALSLS